MTKRIKLSAIAIHSRRIRQITGHERILHADMSHLRPSQTAIAGNTRYAACHGNAHLDSLCDLIQIHMAQYNLVAVDNTDQRTLHLPQSVKRIEQ